MIKTTRIGGLTLWIFTFLFSQFALGASVAEKSNQKGIKIPEVIIAGDSWAQVPCFFGSVGAAFLYKGYFVNTSECMFTSIIGARAENFKAKPAYQKMMTSLKTHPEVKALYLSLGGNDMFSYWNKNMNLNDEMDLFVTIRNHIEEVVNDIHAARPDVWVLVSGYDFAYIHDKDVIKNYQEIFDHMGKPSTIEFNEAFIRFQNLVAELKLDHTVYQQHFGLMHYFYGVPEKNIPPYKTAKPDLISPADNPSQIGGDRTARSSKYAMAQIFDFYYDAHHLRPRGFTRLFEHAIDGYIGHWLKESGFNPSLTPTPEPSDDYDEGVSEQQMQELKTKIEESF